jgi:hypothetical protein
MQDIGPKPANITLDDLWRQVRVDIAGKEVQVAETTSHAWLANQLGHITLGILLASGLALILQWWPRVSGIENAVGSLIAAALVIGWEVRAYWIAVGEAGGPFLLDKKLLGRNAFVAAAYMVLGVLTAFVYREFALAATGTVWWFGCTRLVWAYIFFGALTAIGILLAKPWLRQKIIWQKAALPYLFRLSTAKRTMQDADTPKRLQELIDDELPPTNKKPRQVVIAGPIGSGRTSMAIGIGSEFAFKGATVRYLSAGNLAEFAARRPEVGDDTGPTNIGYWPWSQAQVLVIDDIAPMLGDNIGQLQEILDGKFGRIREVLTKCHTVWVVGSLQNGLDADATEKFAHAIGRLCDGQQNVLLLELDQDPEAVSVPMSISKAKGPRSRARYI